jgi:transketolase
VQDLAVIRSLPEMTILSPADPGEARDCVQWLSQNPCPSYLRLGKAGEPNLHLIRGLRQAPIEIHHGSADTAMVTTGSILVIALDAAHELASLDLNVSVFSCPWLQPVTPEFFQPFLRFHRLLVLEEHLVLGALGSLLRENLPSGMEIITLGISAGVLGKVGSQQCLRRMAGLTTKDLLRYFL